MNRTPLLMWILESYDATYKALGSVPYRQDYAGKNYNVSPRDSVQSASAQASAGFNKRMEKKGHDLRIGRQIGYGSEGSVHQGHIKGTVVKFTPSDREAALANHVLDNQEIHGAIKSLPRFYSVHDTGVRDKRSGAPIHAIHREDLTDVDKDHAKKWERFGYEVGDIGHTDRSLHRAVAEKTGKPLHNVAARLSMAKLRKIVAKHRPHFKGTTHEDEFERVSKDMHHLMRNGVVPCDLGKQNWGQRHNGEVVIRDLGCWDAHQPADPM